MPVLEVQNIHKSFGSTQVLKNISFSLERGQALAIIGSSGSGKTTLLRCLNFLETPNQGRIIVGGETLFLTVPSRAMRRFAGNVCTSAWFSRRLTCSRNIPRWKT